MWGYPFERGGGIDATQMLRRLSDEHEPARGYGKGTRAAFREFVRSGSPALAARVFWEDGSRGNGGAVRVAPVAAYLFRDGDVAFGAQRSASITHVHPDGLAGAERIALVWQDALEPHALTTALQLAEFFTSGANPDPSNPHTH